MSDTQHEPPEPAPEHWSMDLRERRVWLALLAVSSGLIPKLDEHHKRVYGISHHEYTVLIMLAEITDSTAELSTIARRSNASLSRISHTIRRLAGDGYVTLSRSERDGRATSATLTEAGSKFLAESAYENMAEARRLVFDPLSDAQQDELADICLTLLKHWRPDDPHPWVP